MHFISYSDMAADIRRNLYKVPADIDLIVGVPRSGMIAALMLAEQLNKRCTDLDSFLEGRHWSEGGRGRMLRHGVASKVLIIDDTVNSGVAMAGVLERIEPVRESYDITVATVYAEGGQKAMEMVDVWLVDNHDDKDDFFLYEWNVMQHYRRRGRCIMYDMDGVLCKNPPNDKDTAAYESYLPKAVPMTIPSGPIGGICTYRLSKYRAVTEQWLKQQGIDYKHLTMFPALTREERNRTASADYKAKAYRDADWALLFIESDDDQARRIHELCGKPVWCYSNGRMYHG